MNAQRIRIFHERASVRWRLRRARFAERASLRPLAAIALVVIGSLAPAGAGAMPAASPAPLCVDISPQGWTPITEAGGIVAQVQAATGDRGIPVYRARGILAAPVGQILEVLSDNATAAEWMPDLAHQELVDQRSDLERVTRSVYAVPFPFADRELVMRNRLFLDRARGDLVAEAISVDHPLAPPIRGRIRAQMSCSRTRLRPLGPNRTLIECRIQVDPGGRIPAFLADFGLREAPLKFVKALERRAQTAGYPLRPVYRQMLQALGPLPASTAGQSPPPEEE